MRISPITRSTNPNCRPTFGPAILKKITTINNGVLRTTVT